MITSENSLEKIEAIRKRAKDNKANNVKYFLSLYFDNFDKFRNTLFLISISLFGYLGSIQKSLSPKEAGILISSVIFGLISYVCASFIFLRKASYNSELEKNLSAAHLTTEEYNNIVNEEPQIRKRYNKDILLEIFHFSCVIIQAGLLIIAMWVSSQK